MKNIVVKHKGFTSIVIVDDDDFELVSKNKWHIKLGYACRNGFINGKRGNIYMHRIIANTPNGLCTDHINGNGLDNRKCNLRCCTASQNQMNSRPHKDNTLSKYKGVSRYKSEKQRKKPWRAMININKKAKFLGCFETETEAAKAYNDAAIQHHGAFAKLNKIKE